MTLTATWIESHATESPGSGRLWMASDSRISDAAGTLLDEGVKLFEVPLRIFGIPQDPSGNLPRQSFNPFPAPDYETSFGIVCAGSTLLFQQVYATLVPLLSNVQCGPVLEAPSVAQQAGYVARLLTVYSRSLGSHRPHTKPVSIVVGGVDPSSARPKAFDLRPGRGCDGRLEYDAELLEIEEGQVAFRGDGAGCERAEQLVRERRGADPSVYRQGYNLVLDIIEEIAEDEAYPNIGGGVQAGYTAGREFHRVARVSPGQGDDEGIAQFTLNGINVMTLGGIGRGHPFVSSLA